MTIFCLKTIDLCVTHNKEIKGNDSIEDLIEQLTHIVIKLQSIKSQR